MWSRCMTNSCADMPTHRFSVWNAIQTKDGCILSWCDSAQDYGHGYFDVKLILWNINGEILNQLVAHQHPIEGAMETQDGKFLTWDVFGVSAPLWTLSLGQARFLRQGEAER